MTFGVKDRNADITVEPDSIDQSELGTPRGRARQPQARGLSADPADAGAAQSFQCAGSHCGGKCCGGSVSVMPPTHCAVSMDWRGDSDVVGTSPGGITVIDDFGHNPEKMRRNLAHNEGQSRTGDRLSFQPHGFGPLAANGGRGLPPPSRANLALMTSRSSAIRSISAEPSTAARGATGSCG